MCRGSFVDGVSTFKPQINGTSLHDCSRRLLRFFLSFNATAPSGPGPPHSRGFYITHNDAPQSVGLLWMSDQLVAETPTWQHTTLTTDFQASGGIRTHNLSRRAAAHLCLRPHGQWDRPHCYLQNNYRWPKSPMWQYSSSVQSPVLQTWRSAVRPSQQR